MDVRPGHRVRARGLIWDVLEAEDVNNRLRLGLCCAEGDMAGLHWDLYVPPDTAEVVNAVLDPTRLAPLPVWHAMHWAHALNAIPAGSSFLIQQPGRVRVEPYQLVPLMRALDMPRPRLLLADGVGLGKTIQAGLIAAELIARRRAHRILIVVPSGPLLSQWEQETKQRFGLKFTLMTNATELWDVRRTHELGFNPFDAVALCLTSLDFAKQDHVLEEIERTSWDLAIIDEAHHCAGSGPLGSQQNTQRRRLAEAVARCSDGLLLLTATPHDGHDAHFASLIALLDPSLVDAAGGFAGQFYRRHVVRRLKAHIRDARTGRNLFRHRHVIPVRVDAGGPEHETVREFHRTLAAFVAPRLRGRSGTDDALAFVSLLKRSVSTIAACLGTLRVVADRLARREDVAGETRAARTERARALRAWRRRAARFGTLSAADEAGQEALEIESMAESLRDTPDSETAHLIRLGTIAEANDPKLAAVVLEVRLIRQAHARANILIYTEYTDSQIAAAQALRDAPGVEGDVLTIGGRDSEDARAAAAARFAGGDGLILISTDALAEGLNLHQHCFHLIHLDLPYNPNRLEQRNGRIDRYGQRSEPEIRYLYIPGTFEERLLLHLIAKYEKARSALDVMPDTLGVSAGPDADDVGLTGGVSEDPDDLFGADPGAIRVLDRTVQDSSPETVARLIREIDRAFDAFDLMAVSHGWFADRGINAGPDLVKRTEAARSKVTWAEDLPGFVGAVIEAEIGENVAIENEIRLPPDWRQGLDGLSGFDPACGTIQISRDPESLDDRNGRSTGFLGRAHPLVSRAIRRGCQLPAAVAAARGDRLGLLSTFVIEIRVENRPVSRRVAAVMTSPRRAAAEISEWMSFGTPALAIPALAIPAPGAWDRWFAAWAEQAGSDTKALLAGIVSREHDLYIGRHEASRRATSDQLSRWLRVRANLLCGPVISSTGDLFGAPPAGPAWRFRTEAAMRLTSFATDPDIPGPKRREANEVLEIFQAAEARDRASSVITSWPIGLLMLVPADAL